MTVNSIYLVIYSLGFKDLGLSVFFQTEQNQFVTLFPKLMGYIVDTKHISSILRNRKTWCKNTNLPCILCILVQFLSQVRLHGEALIILGYGMVYSFLPNDKENHICQNNPSEIDS